MESRPTILLIAGGYGKPPYDSSIAGGYGKLHYDYSHRWRLWKAVLRFFYCYGSTLDRRQVSIPAHWLGLEGSRGDQVNKVAARSTF
jgi:hypothetical protein